MVRFCALLILVLLLGGGAFAWPQLDRPIATIRVVGTLTAAEQNQVREALGVSLAGGLLSADLDALTRVLLDLSWPRQVSVRRVWPDRLEVSLDKALVVARWNDAYLTMSGEVVQLAAPQGNLVSFECRVSEPLEALDLYQRLQREAGPAGLTIARVEENELGEWTVVFSNTLELALGRRTLTQRLQRFLGVYETELRPRLAEIARVDARYSNGVAVRWRDAGTVGDATLAGLDPFMARPDGQQTRAQHGIR